MDANLVERSRRKYRISNFNSIAKSIWFERKFDEFHCKNDECIDKYRSMADHRSSCLSFGSTSNSITIEKFIFFIIDRWSLFSILRNSFARSDSSVFSIEIDVDFGRGISIQWSRSDSFMFSNLFNWTSKRMFAFIFHRVRFFITSVERLALDFHRFVHSSIEFHSNRMKTIRFLSFRGHYRSLSGHFSSHCLSLLRTSSSLFIIDNEFNGHVKKHLGSFEFDFDTSCWCLSSNESVGFPHRWIEKISQIDRFFLTT